MEWVIILLNLLCTIPSHNNYVYICFSFSYLIGLNRSYDIDAEKEGNVSRFMSHSCNSNCYLFKWTMNGQDVIGVYAKSSISPFTELTFDYGLDLNLTLQSGISYIH